MGFVDALLPPTLLRCSRRVGVILITLGVLALFLFPQSATAGTEVPADRWVTGGMLVLAGLLVRFVPSGTLVALLVHGAAQAGIGAQWAAVLSGGLLVYAGISWLRGRGRLADRHDGHGDDDEHDMHTADVVRENVEAVVMALIIALTVREFLYEAFLIPTASMEPTILGKEPSEGRNHGDRLLATKIPMLTGDPPRWSIVVFKYPLYRKVNYIKRLVGLPGETVEIRAGDIYVDGAVAAKPEEIQDQLWFQEFPVNGNALSVEQAWRSRDGVGTWTFGEDSAVGEAGPQRSSWIGYDQTLDRRDTDLRVGADVDVKEIDTETGAVLLRVQGAGRLVELAIGPSGATLTAPGIAAQPVEGVVLPEGGARVELGVADRVVRIWIDGRLAARVPHEDLQTSGSDRPRVAMGLRGATAELSGFHVAKDLQYGGSAHWDVPDDGFVMLGDNTGSSKDSREWRVYELTTDDGRVFTGEPQVKLEDGSIVSFQQKDGMYRFFDVDGIYRELPVATTTLRKSVPAPFVRRRDLIGRAFVIFFPFPPVGDFRLRFLP